MNDIERITKRLEASGRLREVLDDDGKIRPSPSAIQHVQNEHPRKPDAEKFRIAQAETILDLARKYQVELN